MKKIALHWQILIALVLGVAFGFVSRAGAFEYLVTDYVAIAGTIFIRALRMIIVPLILSSMITGVASLGTGESFGRLSFKTFAYYVTTSLLAIMTGLLMVNLIQPGVGAELGFKEIPADLQQNVEKIGDTLLGIIPTNPIASMANGDILPIIFFSLLFGFFITRISDPYRSSMTNWFRGVFDVMMKMTHFIMLFTPVGVFALMAKIIAETGLDVVVPLLSYMATVVASLMIHALVTLPAILYFIGGGSPIAHAKAMSSALLTVFSTASSSATLPLTMTCVEENAGVSNRVSSFVLPLGATINMDGTALYECVAAMFIAQVYGIELTFLQQMLVVMTALLASIGAAAVPMAGLVMISIILKAVGLPLEGLGLILAVDRILDMMRSTTNVWSDSCGAVVIAKSEGETGIKVLRIAKAAGQL